MRRSLLGLLTLVAVVGLVTTSCQRSATLRVLSINGGKTLRSDLSDFFVYFDKIDSSNVVLFQVDPDSVPVEMQYLEMGAGLPTWTPYEALLDKVTISFKSRITPDVPPPYTTITLPVTQAIQADPSGKSKTTFWITALPTAWKTVVFADFRNEDDPNQIDVVDLAEATMTFSGYDSVANRAVSAAGKFSIEFGNFYDDTSKFGK